MIFISHSNQDQGPYTSLCFALEHENLPYWNQKAMKAGTSLRDQLKEAISKCRVCIFLATRSSVKSQWCLAETGAFWGAGKRIILYSANPDIKELPPLFAGDLWTCDIREVIKQAKEELVSTAEVAEPSEADSTHTTELGAIKEQILEALAKHNSLHLDELEHILRLQRTHLEYHIEELNQHGFIKMSKPLITRPAIYSLSQKGRRYLISGKLI